MSSSPTTEGNTPQSDRLSYFTLYCISLRKRKVKLTKCRSEFPQYTLPTSLFFSTLPWLAAQGIYNRGRWANCCNRATLATGVAQQRLQSAELPAHRFANTADETAQAVSQSTLFDPDEGNLETPLHTLQKTPVGFI